MPLFSAVLENQVSGPSTYRKSAALQPVWRVFRMYRLIPIQIIALRTTADTHSLTNTATKITSKISATCGQANVFKELCS